MKIGNVELKNKVVLCPMAGVTDLPFRLICKEFEPALMTTELVSAKGVFYKNPNNNIILATCEEEKPIALQLFGNDPIIMASQADKLKDQFDIIDINMGCPVPKVVNNHEGSYLMKDVDTACRLVETMVRVVKKPITAKIRIGFTKKTINAVSFAKSLESAGISAITVHGRTRDEYYSGQAHWDIIKEVKEAVKVPVIGNGDIWSSEDALRMIKETNVDAIGIGRSVMGNPWIINECICAIEGKPMPPRPSLVDIANLARKHLQLMVKYKGEHVALLEMRKHLAWYVKGIANSSNFRQKVNESTNLCEMNALIDKIPNI